MLSKTLSTTRTSIDFLNDIHQYTVVLSVDDQLARLPSLVQIHKLGLDIHDSRPPKRQPEERIFLNEQSQKPSQPGRNNEDPLHLTLYRTKRLLMNS